MNLMDRIKQVLGLNRILPPDPIVERNQRVIDGMKQELRALGADGELAEYYRRQHIERVRRERGL